MRIAIFGSTGPTGRLLTQQALAAGHNVTVMVRNPDAVQVQHERLTIQQGDVFYYPTVERAVKGQDVVLAVFGVPYSFEPVDTYSVGITNIIQAMDKEGVRRLVCVSSAGTGRNYDYNAGFFFSVIVKKVLGRQVYQDIRRMERLIQKSNLDWTIVRPSRLTDVETPSAYRTGRAYTLPEGMTTSRVDLARFLLQQAADDQYLHTEVAVASV